MTPVEALQAMLAGEHASVYLYGLLGGRVSESAEQTLSSALASAYNTHRARRDQVHARLRALGVTPVASAVAYEPVGAATTAADIVAEALGIEDRSAVVYAQTVENTVSADREQAVAALADAAVRRLSFGGAPEAFPGMPELAGS